jgi:hypothetical protein
MERNDNAELHTITVIGYGVMVPLYDVLLTNPSCDSNNLRHFMLGAMEDWSEPRASKLNLRLHYSKHYFSDNNEVFITFRDEAIITDATYSAGTVVRLSEVLRKESLPLEEFAEALCTFLKTKTPPAPKFTVFGYAEDGDRLPRREKKKRSHSNESEPDSATKRTCTTSVVIDKIEE